MKTMLVSDMNSYYVFDGMTLGASLIEKKVTGGPKSGEKE